MSTEIKSAIRMRGVEKSFLKKTQRVQALQDIDLDIAAGEIVTLLGHNGAGKSTLLKVLATLVTPDAGDAWVNDINIQRSQQVRRQLGWLATEERSFFWRLTGRQNLDFFSALLNLPATQKKERIEQAVEQLDLRECIDRRFDRYSAGMRQKLALARALLHDPSVLLLDEPTRSIDLETKERLKDTLRDLAHQTARTVVMVTHDHAFARNISDRLIIMSQGRIIKTEECAAAPETTSTSRYVIHTPLLSNEEYNQFCALRSVEEIGQEPEQQRSRIVSSNLDDTLPALVHRGIHLIDIDRITEGPPS
jgi:ABC-2 type transport system ATP-binding protein